MLDFGSKLFLQNVALFPFGLKPGLLSLEPLEFLFEQVQDLLFLLIRALLILQLADSFFNLAHDRLPVAGDLFNLFGH